MEIYHASFSGSLDPILSGYHRKPGHSVVECVQVCCSKAKKEKKGLMTTLRVEGKVSPPHLDAVLD